MVSRISILICLVLLFSTSAWTGMSSEELKEHQQKLIEREMKKEEARKEKTSRAAEALNNRDFDQVIDLTSDIIYEYRLKGAAKAEMLAMRGLAFFQKGDMIKAKEDVDQAISENRQEVKAYLIRSSIYEKENRKEQAIADMETYVRLKPNDQEGQVRLQKLKFQTSASLPVPPQPGIFAKSASSPDQTDANSARQPAADLALKLVEAPDKSYALYKPANWKVNEDPRPESMRITVIAPDQSAAVDFLWIRNHGGQINALHALAAYRQRLVPSGGEIVWSDIYCSPDNSRATVTMRYRATNMSLEGKLYLEASATALSVQGYMAREGLLAQQRPMLYNIMASLAFSKKPVPQPVKAEAFNPKYVNVPLINRPAQDGSLTMRTPSDWGFLAAQGKVITSADNGSQGFAFLVFSGNPILRGATVAQGVIAQPYMTPNQAIQVILAGFGHRNIKITKSQPDPTTNQEFFQQVGRRSDAQDMMVTWTSAKGSSCLGFFKVINAAPSTTGLWFCMLAGTWGPHQDFYLYYPMLEQVAASFSINDQYARRYIQDGLKRARELHDKTVAMMRDNAKGLERQQIDWEARQKQKDFVDSKWDDHQRGNSYWVSDLENGKVYQADSYGIRDKGTNDYYEGSGYNYTNFEGRSPRHPSETMREVSRSEVEQMLSR